MKLEVLHKGGRGDSALSPLLFVHGAWHGAWCWDEHFLDYFAGLGYECVAPSLRGHGGSPGGARMNRYRIADYVADVASVAQSAMPAPMAGRAMGRAIRLKLLQGPTPRDRQASS